MHFDAITYSLLKDRKLRNVAPLCTIITSNWTGSASGEVLFTGDGTTVDFSGKVNLPPVNPLNSFTLHYTIGGVSYDATADSDGNITGEHITSGTINQDGNYEIHFDTAPDNTTNVTADYDYGISPGNLENALDGNPNTSTEIGWTTTIGSGEFGAIMIIPPSNGIYLTGIKSGVWSSSGSSTWKISTYSVTSGGIWWIGTINNAITAITSERIRNSIACLMTVDNNVFGFKFSFVGNSADTYFAKIYEIFVYKLA